MFKKKTDKASAEEAVDQSLSEAKAAAQLEATAAKLQPQIHELGMSLRQLAHAERIKVQEIQAGLVNRLARAGDLEGAVITANEAARHDPERALARLKSAKAAFEKGN